MRDLKLRKSRILIQIFLFRSWSNQWTQNKKGYEVSRGIKFKFKLILNLFLIKYPSPPTCLHHVVLVFIEFVSVEKYLTSLICVLIKLHQYIPVFGGLYNDFELFQEA